MSILAAFKNKETELVSPGCKHVEAYCTYMIAGFQKTPDRSQLSNEKIKSMTENTPWIILINYFIINICKCIHSTNKIMLLTGSALAV